MRLAGEERDHRAAAIKGANGIASLRAPRPWRAMRKTVGTRERKSASMNRDRSRPAEQRADQQCELDVSHPHAAGIDERYEEEESRQAERADRPHGRRMPDGVQREDDERSGQHHAVGDDPPLDVGRRHDDERSAGDRGRGGPERESEREHAGHEEERSRELDGEVARRNSTPHLRQRPRSNAYDSTGTLSYQSICVSQLMHAEPGRTIERRRARGRRRRRGSCRSRARARRRGAERNPSRLLSTFAAAPLESGLQRRSEGKAARATWSCCFAGRLIRLAPYGERFCGTPSCAPLRHEVQRDGRIAGVEHVGAGLRRLGDDDVGGIALDRAADLPAEAAVLECRRTRTRTAGRARPARSSPAAARPRLPASSPAPACRPRG